MAYRFAPSPTGFFHLAGIRTAYFNYLLAKNAGEKFYLRIDDSDLERSNKDHEDQIFKCLKWAGIEFEFAFRQSDRIQRYREIADLLLKNNFARKDGDAIRLTPSKEYLDGFTSWHDGIVGEVKVSEEDKKIMSDMVIFKSDGMPVYHFASCVDDLDLNISTINRGADHITNTARQIAIFDHINIVTGRNAKPKFQHVGLIFANKKKMSKRDNGSSMEQYISGGYEPEAILNTVLRLGWSPKDANYDRDVPIIPMKLAEQMFVSDGKMRGAPANFDMAKLEWYNKKYKARNVTKISV